jgi:DNA-binding MarR family transcriptional regulator
MSAIPDAETIARDRASRAEDGHDALRLWLRLLACTVLVENEVRVKLRERFATTLPRFDLMAQLARHPEGLRMGELSRLLMVTGGNVTGIVSALVAEGMVERRAVQGDRRASLVRLTPAGRRAFAAMAAEHERWIVALTAGLDGADRARLHALLGKLKTTLASGGGAAREPPAGGGGR